MAFWLLACKELNGGVYITRLPQAIVGTGISPGVPDNWFFVGPGTSPSVQEYAGNQFILIFNYLDRLIVRILDISVWPPTEVNPISVSGGPNPPSSFLFGITAAGILNDNYIFNVPNSSSSTGQTKNQFDPPYLKHNLVFFDPGTNTYSVELQPDPTWVTNLPNTPNFFRLYRSPLAGPLTWTLIQDWAPTLDFTDSHVGSLQFRYAATIGAYFNPSNPGSTTDHEESLKGPILAFDSTVHPIGYLLTPEEMLPLNAGGEVSLLPSVTGFGYFTTTQRFFVQVVADTVDYPGLQAPVAGQPPTPLQETPTSAALSVGSREGFLSFPQSTPGLLSDTLKFGQEAVPVTGQPPTTLPGGNAACSLFG